MKLYRDHAVVVKDRFCLTFWFPSVTIEKERIALGFFTSLDIQRMSGGGETLYLELCILGFGFSLQLFR